MNQDFDVLRGEGSGNVKHLCNGANGNLRLIHQQTKDAQSSGVAQGFKHRSEMSVCAVGKLSFLGNGCSDTHINVQTDI